MKRIIAIVVSIALVLGTFGFINVFAASTPTMTVESVSGEVGQTVSVNVVLENNPGFSSAAVKISYDEIRLTLVSATMGSSYSAGAFVNYNLPYITFVRSNNVEENGIFLTLSFTIKSADGDGNVTIEYADGDITDIDENNVKFHVNDGTILVECSHATKTEVTAKSPDCTHSGNHPYFVCNNCGLVFRADGVTQTTVEAETIPALGHDWKAAVCEASKTCSRCGVTEGEALGHDWTVQIEDDAHLREKGADCRAHNTYWYGCSRCGAISDQAYFTGSAAGAHIFTKKIEDGAHLVPGSGADCQHAKQYYYSCQYCDAIGTETWDSTAYGEHQIAAAWTTENGKHFHKCTLCNHKADEAACSGGIATCTQKAVCSVCNVPYGNFAAHDYKTEWNQGNETGHWHDCKNCDAHDTPAAHTPNIPAATEEQAKVCTECGYVIEPKLPHVHRVTKVEGYAATCTEAGQKTYYVCSCGKWFADAEGKTEITDKSSVVIEALGHDWKAADCTTPKTCQRCGITEGTALGHEYTVKVEDSEHLRAAATKCTEYNTYWYECTRCGDISTTEYFVGTTAGDHAFAEKMEDEAHLVPGSGEDCQNVKRYYYDCIYCDTMGNEAWDSTSYGAHRMATAWTTENGQHFHKCTVTGCTHIEDEAACSGGIATCTEKAVCAVCYVPYGNFAAHDYKTEWSQGDETGHWHDCKNCDAHETPTAHTPNIPAATEEQAKICTVCGYVIEPKLSHVHRVTKVEEYAATCTEAGQKTYYVCDCGKWFADAEGKTEIMDKSSVVIEALGHDWKVADCTTPKTCRRCGVTEGSANGHADTDKNGKCDLCGHAVATADPSAPKTDDESHLLLWIVLFLINGAGIILLVDKKKYFTR